MLLRSAAMAAAHRSDADGADACCAAAATAVAHPPGADACCAAAAERASRNMAGSRRRRLWELPDESHCPLIGVCLPLPVLRKLAAKVMVGPPISDDYELHSCVVQECSKRNPLTEALQRELERRCALALRRFADARDAAALAALWRDAVERGDVAQALWAALTHPRCDSALAVRICRDVHMLQHQAGAMARADLRRSGELSQRAADLEGELHGAQQRCLALQSQRQAEAEALGAQLMRVRAELIARDTGIAALRAELAALREATPDLASRRELTQRVAALQEQQRHLHRHNAELREQIASATRRGDAPAAPHAASDASAPDTAPATLGQRAVLCVGGRGGDVAHYRDCIERHGGRFLYHDGGAENGARALDTGLAAADLVVCQAGCISHNAYWLVKDHCKRTGKRCLYVDRPSIAGLARGLRDMLSGRPASVTAAP